MSNTAEEDQVKPEEIKVEQIEVNQVQIEQVETEQKQVEEVQVENQSAENESDEEKKAKAAAKAQIRSLIKELSELFPNAIAVTKEDVKPLMIGVFQSVMQKTDSRYDKLTLRKVFAYYCRSLDYLNATVQQTHRVDLDGNPVQEITEQHKEIARQKIKIVKTIMGGGGKKSAKDIQKQQRAEAHELRVKAQMEAAAIKRAEKAALKAAKQEAEKAENKAAKAAEKAAEKAAKAAEKATVAPKVATKAAPAKPKSDESTPVAVVVKTKKPEAAAPTVIIKKKPEITISSTPAVNAEGETGEPVRKKLSLKSKA